MVKLLIVFLIGMFLVAMLVTAAVSSRSRNNFSDILSDLDRNYYRQHHP
ncbi:MAG: hypothetical protein K2N05_11860 [Muribaculaceae bacterium]|nr:hypothetical protein [Muribaculaceae bacterium]